MLVETTLFALSVGVSVQLGPGDTLRVSISFSYTAPEDLTGTLYASILGGAGAVKSGSKPLSLKKATTPITKTDSVDIVLPTEGLTDGTYSLAAGIAGYPETTVTISNCIILSGFAPAVDWVTMIGPILVIGMMAMMVSQMAPMMKEGFK